jgi:fatty acid desaturase
MWLNYQIEHHVWPKLTMLGYQRVQPKLKALCDTYGVPYIQQSVWTRLRRTFEVMLGDNAMPDVSGQVVTEAATVAEPSGSAEATSLLAPERSPELALA